MSASLKSYSGIRILSILVLLLFIFTYSIAGAFNSTDAGLTQTPSGMVILIVDGLGSGYINPEKDVFSMDGNILSTPDVNNILSISEDGFRSVSVRISPPEGENGHAVLVTGSNIATSSTIGYQNSTIYDIGRNNGIMSFAILEKGESPELLAKQDVAIYDTTTSINDPSMEIICNSYFEKGDEAVREDVVSYFEERNDMVLSFIEQYPQGSIERYHAYNQWAIDTALGLIDIMGTSHPQQRFILTVNIGAVDTAGMYRRNEGYSQAIEAVDGKVVPLHDEALNNGLAFVLTSDHGIAFESVDGRGGSKSEKYSSSPEVLYVPFIASSRNIIPSVMTQEHGQDDIAPTLLCILDLPAEMRFSTGGPLGIKEYANIGIRSEYDISVNVQEHGDIIVSTGACNEHLISGLEKGVVYEVFVLEEATGETEIITVDLNSDEMLYLEHQSTSSSSHFVSGSSEFRRNIGSVLIVLINVIGLILIYRISKD